MSYDEPTPAERSARLLDLAVRVDRVADFMIDDDGAQVFYAARSVAPRKLATSPRDMSAAVRAVHRIIGGR